MSLILGYVNRNSAIIMSDGRAGGVVASELYDKTRRINDRIILGFCGYKEEGEFVLDTIINEVGNEIVKYNLDDFLNEYVELFKVKPEDKEFKSTFITLGYDKSGNMCTSIFGLTTGLQIEKHVCEGIRYCTVGGSIEGKIIDDIYRHNLFCTDVTILDRLRNTIIGVSMYDVTVNSNCYYQCIGSLDQLNFPDPGHLL